MKQLAGNFASLRNRVFTATSPPLLREPSCDELLPPTALNDTFGVTHSTKNSMCSSLL